MKPESKAIFSKAFSSWSRTVPDTSAIDWTEQMKILNDVADLITPELSIEEITSAIYSNVNQLIDAYQFAVGLYNEKDAVISFKGMIEDGKRLPDFSMNLNNNSRLGSWCIRNEHEIFMNDFDLEYGDYLEAKPVPVTGSEPKAAIYVPLRLHDKVVGFITVRTIHKNVYRQHHLYILKTVGNFIVRALELSKFCSNRTAKFDGSRKNWQWCKEENLSSKSKTALQQLTGREKEVLFLLLSGLSNKALAEKLFVSSATVKTHTLSIYQKMDVPNRTSAILKAFELGWVL